MSEKLNLREIHRAKTHLDDIGEGANGFKRRSGTCGGTSHSASSILQEGLDIPSQLLYSLNVGVDPDDAAIAAGDSSVYQDSGSVI